MSTALTATNVRHEFGSTLALRDVSLLVPAGSVVAIVGESGSGKTTLLRCFNRMIEPTGGEILLNGRPVRDIPVVELRRSIGYVPQNGGLLPHWTVRRNAALVPTLIGTANAAAAADRSLELVGLDPHVFGGRYPHELSGGQRQRVALARALAGQQGVVLLDEPFGALDAISRSEMHEAFEHVHRALAFTALLITHDIAEAARLASHVAVMRAGVIEQQGDFAMIAQNPATEYVARLIERASASALHLAQS
jgi:osmoprotectant transport system ATP-binding protein